MATLLLWSTAMWSNATMAGVVAVTLKQAPSDRPSSSREMPEARPRTSRWSHRNLTAGESGEGRQRSAFEAGKSQEHASAANIVDSHTSNT